SFRAAGSMTERRWAHTATLLRDGRVLVLGGFPNLGSGATVATAEIYDPVTNAFHAFPAPRALPGLTATVLGSGEVLVVGGFGLAHVFDPVAGAFHPVVATARTNHTATLLGSGRVLVTGGVTEAASETNDAE